MVENNIRMINDLDIQIKDLEETIKNTKSVNDRIKSNIQKRLQLLQQLEVVLSQENGED